MTPDDILFRQVTEILEPRLGEKEAITIDGLCYLTASPRRRMEVLLEVHLQDFPFYVISTTAGYFRPVAAEEINHCLASLQSRAMCIFLRKRKVIQGALAAGYQRQGRQFLDPPCTVASASGAGSAPRIPASDLFQYAERRVS